MTARFQGPLVDPDTGCVKLSIQSSRPADAVDYRGMIVSPDGTVYGVNDTGQPRVFQDGIAIDASTGLTLIGSGPVVNTAMGGLGVNVAGSVVPNSPPDVVHQGVALKNTGELCQGGFGPELVPDPSLSDWDGFSTQNNGNAPPGWVKVGTHDANNYATGGTGILRIISSGTFTGAGVLNSIALTLYRVEYEYADRTSGEINLVLNGDATGLSAAVGVRTVFETTSGAVPNEWFVQRQGGVTDASLSFLSIKEVLG